MSLSKRFLTRLIWTSFDKHKDNKWPLFHGMPVMSLVTLMTTTGWQMLCIGTLN